MFQMYNDLKQIFVTPLKNLTPMESYSLSNRWEIYVSALWHCGHSSCNAIEEDSCIWIW